MVVVVRVLMVHHGVEMEGAVLDLVVQMDHELVEVVDHDFVEVVDHDFVKVVDHDFVKVVDHDFAKVVDRDCAEVVDHGFVEVVDHDFAEVVDPFVLLEDHPGSWEVLGVLAGQELVLGGPKVVFECVPYWSE